MENVDLIAFTQFSLEGIKMKKLDSLKLFMVWEDITYEVFKASIYIPYSHFYNSYDSLSFQRERR
jgi:hypothetical protein